MPRVAIHRAMLSRLSIFSILCLALLCMSGCEKRIREASAPAGEFLATQETA